MGTTNPLLNLFAGFAFVKRMMEKNHDGIMDRGCQGLKAVLEGAAPRPAG